MTEDERIAVWNEAVIACSKVAHHFKEPFGIVLSAPFVRRVPTPLAISIKILELAKKPT